MNSTTHYPLYSMTTNVYYDPR